MFGINNENLEQAKVEREALGMFAKMISETILNSETASESMKLSVRIMDKAQDLQDSIHDLVNKFIDHGKRANAETLKTVLEYLGMVELGIKQFIESTPFVPDEEEGGEE